MAQDGENEALGACPGGWGPGLDLADLILCPVGAGLGLSFHSPSNAESASIVSRPSFAGWHQKAVPSGWWDRERRQRFTSGAAQPWPVDVPTDLHPEGGSLPPLSFCEEKRGKPPLADEQKRRRGL